MSDKLVDETSSSGDGGLNRRGFIKQAGSVAGGLMAAGAVARSVAADAVPEAALLPKAASANSTNANDKIQVALIGYGGRGHALLNQALGMRNYCQVVAVCDLYEKRALAAQAEVAKRGGEAKKFNNWEDVVNLPDVDAVFVATPDHWHAPISLAAMRKGKDVYCEKPMTHTIAEAREMAETAEQLKRIVQVGSQTTSSDQWWKAKQAIADGMIGKLLLSQGSYHRNSTGGEWNYGIDANAGPDKTGEDHLDWDMWQKPAENHYEWYAPRFFRFRKYWDYSGGIATDLFFHVMAPLNICWPEPEFPWRASGMGGIYAFDDGREVPDTFMLAADYPSGHSVVLSSSMANSMHIPGLIRGHEGTITMVKNGKFEEPVPNITVTPEDFVKDKFMQKYPDAVVRKDTDTKFRPEDRVELDIKCEIKEPLGAHFKNFFECIRSREETRLSARKAYRVQVAITLGIDSYRQGKVLYFDPEKQMATDKRPASTLKLSRPGILNGDNVTEPGYGKAKLFSSQG